jgi:hypothetical protein
MYKAFDKFLPVARGTWQAVKRGKRFGVGSPAAAELAIERS